MRRRRASIPWLWLVFFLIFFFVRSDCSASLAGRSLSLLHYIRSWGCPRRFAESEETESVPAARIHAVGGRDAGCNAREKEKASSLCLALPCRTTSPPQNAMHSCTALMKCLSRASGLQAGRAP